MKKLLALIALVPAFALANTEGVPLESAPVDLHDKASLQRGAAAFVNHCLNCHSAAAMRYSRLEDIGLTEAQIKDNLLFTSDKVGDPMVAAMDPGIAKAAFGIVPPDLSLAARSRTPDWLYTYLRSFYRDPASKSGWNNTVFPNVAMPHVLWEYQGTQGLEVTQKQDHLTGDVTHVAKLVMDKPGTLTAVQYDRYVGDLVNYLTFMAEPAQGSRKQWGIVALFVLTGFFLLAFLLKGEYWKDVR